MSFRGSISSLYHGNAQLRRKRRRMRESALLENDGLLKQYQAMLDEAIQHFERVKGETGGDDDSPEMQFLEEMLGVLRQYRYLDDTSPPVLHDACLTLLSKMESKSDSMATDTTFSQYMTSFVDGLRTLARNLDPGEGGEAQPSAEGGEGQEAGGGGGGMGGGGMGGGGGAPPPEGEGGEEGQGGEGGEQGQGEHEGEGEEEGGDDLESALGIK